MNKDEMSKNDNGKYRILFENISDAILVTEIDSKIVDANKAAENITGYSKGELLSMNSIDFYPLNRLGAILDFIKESQNEDKFVDIEILAKNKIRKSVAVSSSCLTIGGRMYYLNILRDITQEKELDRIKTDFISIASHQLRTPLTGIKWYCELLLKKWAGGLSGEQVNFLNQIYISNDRMIKLINDLLNVSRMESGVKYELHFKEENYKSIIDALIEEQKVPASVKNIKLIIKSECPSDITLRIDKEKIFQAFQNVVDNAIKYSPIDSIVIIGCKVDNGQIIFYVKDQGFGIPERQQHRIFEKFFRAENAILAGSGTGLGLFIVKFIVESHGGKIWFESEENKGTTFYISLPLVK